MYRTASFVVAVVVILLGSQITTASERVGDFIVYPDAPEVISLDGAIGDGTVGDFRAAMAKRPNAQVVLLNSSGGDVDDALKLAAMISARGMGTAVPRSSGCYSACSYLFFAGREHVAQGALGVHQVRMAGTGAGAAYDGDVRQALRRYGASDSVIDVMSNTPPSQLHVFSAKEIVAFAINRSDGANSLTASFASR